ncbi:hypothetical protein G3O08_17185 [Cryomorpha ignava]|uniref:PIN domain-containing protein n=1 Tax=Cryomorpha ignava TaxID=101383 RepID=A0A7K3WU78_9FLAO|nr:hypothetical protein [Cryomorpha ignava]NEN25233.1 hypothetical protein [Cryomorpha ignava]
MDNIIVDSNILFSAILNLNSRMGQILINGQEYYDFTPRNTSEQSF